MRRWSNATPLDESARLQDPGTTDAGHPICLHVGGWAVPAGRLGLVLPRFPGLPTGAGRLRGRKSSSLKA